MRCVARSEDESTSSGVDWYLSAWQSRAWQTLTNLRGMTLPWTQVCGIWRRRSEVARVSVGGGYDAGRTPYFCVFLRRPMSPDGPSTCGDCRRLGVALPNCAFLDQAAPSPGPPPRRILALAKPRPAPARSQPGGSLLIYWLIRSAFDAALPSFSALQCPGYGRRVEGAFGVARDRFATPDLATVPQGSGACENDG